jgi:hypothetical protein
MAESIRKTVMALKKETVEGGLATVTPASNEFVALQSGFSVTPNFETLENTEIGLGGIGKAAPIIGTEAPTVSLSHYMRHSGVVGTAPQFAPLIESAIGVEVDAHAVERLTASGGTAGSASAAATVKLASGGSDFERGKAILLKNAAGYQIRPVHSVATNDLTLGFNLPAAPETGVGTGRAILYKPADAPTTVSATVYDANGAATEAVAGLRVTSMALEANAREILNTSFDLEGIKYYFDFIDVGSPNVDLDFNDGGAKTCAIAAKVYTDPHELAQAVEDAMNSVSSGITVVYNDTGANAGKFTVTKSSGTLSLLPQTGPNAATPAWRFIGITTDQTGALTYTGAESSWQSFNAPSFDAGEPLIVKDMEVMMGDFDDYGCAGAQSFTLTVGNTINKVGNICSSSGIAASIVDSREVTVETVLTLVKHDADKWRRFREGATTRFAFMFGVKSGGNWVEGKSGCCYLPQAKISAFSIGEVDGILTVNLTLTAFVTNDGLGEVYLNFV